MFKFCFLIKLKLKNCLKKLKIFKKEVIDEKEFTFDNLARLIQITAVKKIKSVNKIKIKLLK